MDALPCVAAALAFAPCLQGKEFVFDDRPAVLDNPDVSPLESSSPRLLDVFAHDFWGQPLDSPNSHRSYRPLAVLLLRGLRSLSATPRLFRAVNIGLHVTNTYLTLLLARQILRRVAPARFAALLFALHPLHVEPVAACVGVADLTCSAIVLAATTVYLKLGRSSWGKVSLASCATGFAVLFKEQGIMLSSVVLVLDVLFHHKFDLRKKRFRQRKDWVLKCSVLAVMTGLVLWLRLWVMNFTPPAFQEQDNPAAFLISRKLRLLNRVHHYSLNAWLMLAPDWLCFDWAMGCVPLIVSGWDARNLASLILVLCASALSLRCLATSDVVVASALALAVLPFLPSSNVLFDVGFVVAERNLYLSVAGHALLVAEGFERVRACVKSRIVGLLAIVFFASLFAKSWTRSLAWRTESALFSSGLHVCPANAKVHYNLGKLAADAGDADSAEVWYRHAIGLHADYEHALNNLGNVLRDKPGGLSEAEALLRRAVEVSPTFAAAWMNLGITLAAKRAYGEAEAAYEKSLSLRKHSPDCHFNLGNLYLKTGRKELALERFRAAVSLNNRLPHAWSNLIMLSDELGDFDAAEHAALEAIDVFPDRAVFYFHLANIYGKQNQFKMAEEKYQQALALKPTDPLFLTNLGVLYHRWGKVDRAREMYEEALQLDPKQQSARENLRRLA